MRTTAGSHGYPMFFARFVSACMDFGVIANQ